MRATTSILALAARAAIAAVAVYQVLLAAVIFLRPEVNPTLRPISDYAIGRFGWTMVLAFVSSAVSDASLFVAIRPHVRGWLGRLGVGLLLMCVIGTTGVGLFVADPIATPMDGLSTIGTLHVVFGSSALVLLPFAALLINLSLARNNPAWAASRRVLLWTAGLPLPGFVLSRLLATVIPAEGWPPHCPGADLGAIGLGHRPNAHGMASPPCRA